MYHCLVDMNIILTISLRMFLSTIKCIPLRPRSRAKLKGAFTRILQLARILVREQGLDLHDVPQFFHLDFKVGRANSSQ